MTPRVALNRVFKNLKGRKATNLEGGFFLTEEPKKAFIVQERNRNVNVLRVYFDSTHEPVVIFDASDNECIRVKISNQEIGSPQFEFVKRIISKVENTLKF